MTELLFECYQVPSLCYGIDSILSYYYNINKGSYAGNEKVNKKTSMIISSGYMNSYIIPFVNGSIRGSHAKRTSIAGFHTSEFMQKLLHTKYSFPLIKNALSYDRLTVHFSCLFINYSLSK